MLKKQLPSKRGIGGGMMDKELSKAICDTLRPVALRLAEEVVEGCEECKSSECDERFGQVIVLGESITTTCKRCMARNTHLCAEPYYCLKHKCPTCTPQRELMLAWAKKLLWKRGYYECDRCYRIEETEKEIWCWRCGIGQMEYMPERPRFSIEPIEGHLSLVQFMKDMDIGEDVSHWTRIEHYLYHQIYIATMIQNRGLFTENDVMEIVREIFKECFSNTTYLATAINSYFTRGEG
jgi:hypothetical protein